MRLGELADLRLVPSPDPLAEQSGLGALVFAHSALATAAAAFFKIASDVALLTSGPNAGFNELQLAETGLTCSSLPGKSNPDATECLAQVCVQIVGADSAVAFAGSQGQFELSGFAPLAAFNVLRSMTLLADALQVFARFGVAGLEARTEVLERYVARSVMLVTAVAPVIGYDAAAKIARAAYEKNLDLRDAALASGLVDEDTYDRLVRPQRMLGPDGG